MTVSTSQGVGSVNQGSYTPAPEPAVSATPEAVSKVSENTTTAKSDTPKKEDGRENEVNQEAVKKAVADINKRANGTEAVFGFHDKTNRITIKIVDKESKEVIKEVPAEKTLDLIAKAWEMAGIMVDEKR